MGAEREQAMRGEGGQSSQTDLRSQARTTPSPQRSARAARPLGGGLPILLGALAGLAICALAFFILSLVNRPAAPPDSAPAARAICADLTSQRYDQLYTLLSPDLQAQGSAAQFAASQRELDSLLGVVRACHGGASANGGVESLTLTLQRGQSASSTETQVTLTQAQGGWRISSYDQNF